MFLLVLRLGCCFWPELPGPLKSAVIDVPMIQLRRRHGRIILASLLGAPRILWPKLLVLPLVRMLSLSQG